MRDFKALLGSAVEESQRLMQHQKLNANHFLYAILLELEEIRQAQFGTNLFRISAVSIGTSPTLILDRALDDRPRKADLWLDSTTGGPDATVRVGSSGVSTSSGGMLMLTGQVNPLGKVDANTKLFAVSSVAINGYVAEYSS